jgi:PAS domain S-box-containing protein
MAGLVRAPEFSELETLVACAADGSLAGASRRLGISRPAVAKRIAQLEAIVGARLLDRQVSGVRLTEDGATLVARATRLLAERDALVEAILERRRDGTSVRPSGVRTLVGAPTAAAQVAQRPEAVLVAAERLFELVFQASATGIVISDPETSLIHEANDAFCRFVGRGRNDVVGANALEAGTWYALEDRDRLVEAVRRDGVARGFEVRAELPDGRVRTAEATTRLIELAGRPQLFTTIDDVTDERRTQGDMAAAAAIAHGLSAMRAQAARGGRHAALETAGMTAMRAGERFGSVAICDGGDVVAHDGAPLPDDLVTAIEQGPPVPDAGGVARLEIGEQRGLAVSLGGARSLVVLTGEQISPGAEELFGALLEEVATVVGR